MPEFRPILEREAAIRKIWALLQVAQAGRGETLFLIGEAGLGKTTLLRQACRDAAAFMRVGLGVGDAMESSLPFGLIAQVLDALDGPDLLLKGVGLHAAASEVRAARFYRVLRWLETSRESVLLLLDDLHWSDPESLSLLSFLCRRISGLPVAVIATLRPWPRAAADLADKLAEAGLASNERLAPLTEDATRTLLAGLVPWIVSDITAKRVWRLCAGNPLLAQQVALALCEGDRRPALDGGPSSLAASDLILASFAGLPDAGLRCARAASVLGARFRLELAVEVAQLSEGEAAMATEALCGSGLVSEAPGGWAMFVHPLFGQSLYSDLQPALRRRLHALAFAALLRNGMESEAAEHAIRADLVGVSGAVAVLERTGLAAMREGGSETAVRRLQAAVEFAGSRAGPELMLGLGKALLGAGRPAEAISLYERLVARGGLSMRARGVALRMLGRARFAVGAHSQAGAAFHAARVAVEVEDPGEAAQVLLDHALSSWMTAGPRASLALVLGARELADWVDDALRSGVETAHAFLSLLVGDGKHPRAGEPVTGVPCRQTSAEHYCVALGPPGSYGLVAVLADHLSSSGGAGDSVLLDATTAPSPGWAAASLAVTQAVTAIRCGQLKEGLVLAIAAAAMAQAVPMIESFAGAAQADALLQLGRAAESRARCDEAEEVAAARDERVALLWLWHVRAQQRSHEGCLDEACGLYRQIEELSVEIGLGAPCLVPWAAHAIDVYIRCDLRDDAARVMDWLGLCSHALPCRWPRITLARGQAALEAASGAHDAADAQFRIALALHDGIELPIEKAETLLAYGSFLRRTGQSTRARRLLAEALRLAETAGAARLGGEVGEEFRVARGRRRRAREPMDGLTAQEERIARLAAGGLSNRQIADQVRLSVKTVEFHLQQVYSKLGIRSRRQLILMRQAGWEAYPAPNGQGYP